MSARGSAAAARPMHVGETLPLRPGRDGLVVRCRAGTVVVTQEGDLADHVLGASEEFRTSRRGRVVVWALANGAVETASLAA